MGVNSGSRDRNVLRIASLEGSQVLTEGITTITTITMITTGTEGDEGDIWGFGVGLGSGRKGILASVWYGCFQYTTYHICIISRL